MKGVIFCLLKKMIVTRVGPQAWQALVDRTPLATPDAAYVGPATYPDADLYALVGTASAMTGQPIGELLAAFGRFILPDLVRVSPLFVPPGTTARSFLRSVDRVIHVEVRKLHPEVNLPYFAYEEPAPDRLVMLYRSPRMLCSLVTGFIAGTGDHFGVDIAQAHTQCMRDGHHACRFELQFGANGW